MHLHKIEDRPRIHKNDDHCLSAQFKIASYFTKDSLVKPESKALNDTDKGKILAREYSQCSEAAETKQGCSQ